ncbi:hypothetical protein ENBRE01_0113 [Enteropsectra breve]|nr:hypothetical protein ENBRE01_0113 [Enteropsectra breve]
MHFISKPIKLFQQAAPLSASTDSGSNYIKLKNVKIIETGLVYRAAQMNNCVIYELVKYMHSSCGTERIGAAMEMSRSNKRDWFHIRDYLDKKLSGRLDITEMLNKNILKKNRGEMKSFKEIQRLLDSLKIPTVRANRTIDASIAERAKTLDFRLRKALLIRKLELEKYERIFKKDK